MGSTPFHARNAPPSAGPATAAIWYAVMYRLNALGNASTGTSWIGVPSTPPSAFTMSAATCTPWNSASPPGPCEPLSG